MKKKGYEDASWGNRLIYPALQKGWGMLRKTIAIPVDMVAKIDEIATREGRSFSSVVRSAIQGYFSACDNDECDRYEPILKEICGLNMESIQTLEKLEQRLDETHRLLNSS